MTNNFFEKYHKIMQSRDKLNAELSSNLNFRPIETDGQSCDISDNSIDTESVSVYFRNLEDKLIDCIGKWDVVVGCVAWLTNERILDALSNVGCAIVVQKEDFLRPDIGSNSGWSYKLREMYERLSFPVDRYHVNGTVGRLSVLGDPVIQGVRCVGNYNYEKKPAFPRMHNKFLVFCTVTEYEIPAKSDDEFGGDYFWSLNPECVWTGSFNFTQNAIASLENAVILRNPLVAKAYYNEWSQIEAISESLDWDSVWCAPEWRIGT